MKKIILSACTVCLAGFVFLPRFLVGDDVSIKKIDVSVENINVSLGEQKTLLAGGSFGLHYFTDEGFVILQNKPVFRALMTSAIETYLLEGESLEKITSARKVLAKGEKGSIDNGYIGASGGYRHSNGMYYVVCHVEDQEGMPPIPGGIPGFFARVVLATSPNGTDWTKAGAIITSNKPKEYSYYEGQADRGAAEPGMVVDKNKRWLYAYYTELSRQDGRGVQICMARADLTKGTPGPGMWTKFYNGSFSEPGLGGRDTPIISALKWDQAETLFPQVVYSKKLNKYVMILAVNFWKEYIYKTGLKESGIYISLSDDAIHWGEPKKLITDYCVPLVGKSLSWNGTIVFDDNSSTDGWLVYGYSPSWGHLYNGGTPHYLVGRRIHLGNARMK